MRKILAILAFFSCFTLAAQPYTTTEQREAARGFIMPYATAEEAVAAAAEHRYGALVEEWSAEGEHFTASFTVPFAWTNRQVLMRIASASADYELWINGRRAAYNADGNTTADYNITKLVKEGRNEAEIRLMSPSAMTPLESWKERQKPAIGRVELLSSPTMGVRDVLVETTRHEASILSEIGIVVKSYALNPRTVQLHYELIDPNGRSITAGSSELTLRMRGEDTIRFVAPVVDSLCWSRERPQHHTLLIRTQREGRNMEFHRYPLGLRSVELQEGNLLINGHKETLHSAVVDPTTPISELQALRERGINTLRVKAGTIDPQLYAACDTLGLYLIAQAPINTHKSGTSRAKGGNPSNNPAWRAAFIERVENCYHTTKRHPSVIAFSIAEDSANGICLYESYRTLKRFGEERPIIYPAAGGEWNNDVIK
ncbi:MAG: hypothetical protein IKZ12_03340 [Alistipes sp.]|nr:hypothetical protein [Alistipes sp.]